MLRSLSTSIRSKLLFVTFSIVIVALLVTAVAVVAYDARTYHSQWVNDLLTQADIVGTTSSAALSFNDAKAADENLASLRLRPAVLTAAIYDEDGKLFAQYVAGAGHEPLPERPQGDGYMISGDRIAVFHAVKVNEQQIGTVYLRARYELVDRISSYLVILALAIAASLAVAFVMAAWLQTAITGPVLAVASVANQVMQRRDYTLRVSKTTEDEVGTLVDAFNDMLAQLGRRSQELEATVAELSREMRDRQAAEDALRLADKRKDEFLATLAHELRNPLAPIRNGLEILKVTTDPEVAAEFRKMMERQLQQLVRLVDDLLEVSRISTGKLVLRKTRVNLSAVLSAAIESIQPLITAKGQSLSVQLPSDEVELEADATRLSQIFANILNNATKYTDVGGHIRVSAKRDKEIIDVTIADNGIGIAPHQLPVVFDMFVQIDSSLERSQGGLGVGLALSRRLAELHGGTISARSDGRGCGSEFTVRLPLAASSAMQDARREETSDAPVAPRRVLLVDDNRDFATSLARLLELKGHEVQTAFDAETAEKAASDFRPDIAFIDLGLPDINGYELARRLRSADATRKTMLVAVTGWGQDRDRQMSREAGFSRHLVKPVDVTQIIDAVTQVDASGAP